MRARKPLVGALLLCLLSGCVSFPTRYATLECNCRADSVPAHRVSLKAPTGKWAVSGHGGGLYGEVAWLSIRLPEKPVAPARYDASQVVVVNEGAYPSVTMSVTGGEVQIDPLQKKVTLSLQTPDGAFWANGVYPLR